MTITPTTPKTVSLHDPIGLADLVRDCGVRNLPIVDYGVAHGGVGHPPPTEHVRLTQAAGDAGVIEHYERDLTVRAAAGATMGALRAALRPTGQFIPIDCDDDLTLGEVINHNVYGSLRASYPSIRDLLLGLRYIDADGRQIHVGGRTVKNVAGYDLTRFMVGGLGEFGLIYEATLRTYAIPERSLAVDLRVDDPAALDRLLPSWLLADAAPGLLSLSNLDGGWTARVGFFGRMTSCAVQLRSLETLLDGAPGIQIAGSGYGTLEGELAEVSLRRAWRRSAGALVKIVVPPAATGAVCQALADASPAHPKLMIEATPVHGRIFLGGDLDAEQTLALSAHVDALVQQHHGFRVWYARPKGCEHLAPFAPAQPDWSMIFKLKRTMDPGGLFNPGRFVPVNPDTPSRKPA